jgi:hypothetical protein
MQWKTKGCLKIFLDLTVAFDNTSTEATAIATAWHATEPTTFMWINWIQESRNMITTVMGDTLKEPIENRGQFVTGI